MTTIHGLAMSVTTKQVDGKTCLKYTYTTPGPDGIRFTFYNLSEVGEPHKKQAGMLRDHLATQLGKVVRSQELGVKPWVADTLVTLEEAAAMDEAEAAALKEFRMTYLGAKA